MTTAPTFGLEDEFNPAGFPDEVEEQDTDLDGDTADGSDLAAIRAELAANVTPTIDLAVPTRPGWAVRVRADFSSRQVDTYRRKARDKNFIDGVDGIRFAAMLVGAQTTAVLRHGAPLVLDGTPQTFATKDLQQLLGADSVATAVRALYGLDGHLDAAARRLMAEAGYGDEADLADPTA